MERNIALKLMYDGTAYHGWQVQKNAVTVAETLEKALSTVVCHPVKVHRRRPHRRRGPRRGLYRQLPHHLHHPRATGMPLAVNTRLPRGHRGGLSHGRCREGFNAIGSCLEKGVHLPDLQLPHSATLFMSTGLGFIPSTWTRR